MNNKLLLGIPFFYIFCQTLHLHAEETLINNSLRIHGSNTVGEKFAPLLIKAYIQEHQFIPPLSDLNEVKLEKKIVAKNRNGGSSLTVELHAHGSSTGFKDLLEQTTDIAMSSRPIKAKERLQLAKIYPSFMGDDVEHVIAYDGLAVIVHPNNPVSNLSMLELSQVFSGDIINWNQIGGHDQPITLFARDNNSGTFDTFKSLVLKAFDKKLTAGAYRIESSKQLVEQVMLDEGAVGFVGISHTAKSKILAIAKKEEDHGILPNRYTIGTEDYALSRKLYLYLPKEMENPTAHQFVSFVASNAGQKLASSANLISYYPTKSRPRVRDSHISSQYKNLAMHGYRLSITFRLIENKLEPRAIRDLERLVGYSQHNPFSKIVLVGLWDDGKSNQPTLKIANEWMSLIKSQLNIAEIEPWLVDGGYFPIENSRTKSAQKINQRVEVWVL